MKVLAVSSYGALGGGELSLAEFLVHRPTNVEPVALLVEDGPLRSHLVRRGVPTWAAHGFDGRPSPIQLGRFTRALLGLLESTDPDVVWATGLKAAYLAVPACRFAGVPVVWHKIDFSLDAVLTRPLAAAVNGVVGVSAAVAEALGPTLRRRRLLAVVGPPVRLALDLRIAPNEREPTIGTMATLTPIKGQRHIIEAAGILLGEFPDLRVVLAGNSSPDHPTYPGELRALADSLGLGERLELTGFVKDVAQTLGRLTVFVNATYRDEQGFGWEGLSGAMLEASWAGLPVVATRGGGTPEGLVDGSTGTLVEPADPAGLAHAIAPYLRDRVLARATGEAGWRFTRERFAPDVAATRLFGALGEVL
ncbi:MAG TPA: glycosyltransferase family 4 protein [Solirubrobacteraceae bacterium]|jgi:glycosyltransferase involved in cell wall biosynthesis|nr:glycosyltransferase family 4 protein [Solirubrobacteraceae bacterium]